MHLVIDELLLRERRVWTTWFDEVVDLEGDGSWAARASGELALTVDGARAQVRGALEAQVARECNLCLAHYLEAVTAELFEVCLIAGEAGGEAEWDEDDEVWRVSRGGVISLTEMVRQAVLLALPTRAVCGADCPQASNVAPSERSPAIDARWAALTDLKVTGEDDGGSEA